MYIDNIILENIKSFKGHNQINFSRSINTIVGINNSGKSTIINSILILQYGIERIGKNVVTIGENKGMIRIGIAEHDKNIYNKINDSVYDGGIYFNWKNNVIRESYQLKNRSDQSNSGNVGQIQQIEPSNFIYPHLSTRNQPKYVKAVSKTLANQVNIELHNIYPKIDRIINSRNVNVFKKECKNILGIDIETVLTNEGREAGLNIDDNNQISVENMGGWFTQINWFYFRFVYCRGKIICY